MFIQKQPSILEKLSLLSRDSQYDLACACATAKDEHRRRSKDGSWVYPVTLPNGGTSYLFKTLLSNECVNDCKYCPLRSGTNAQRCRLEPQDVVKAFYDYYHARKVQGLFLSSGVIGTPDKTMEKINLVGKTLRKNRFYGYIHLKILPGSSEAAIRETLSVANAVSINIESATDKHFKDLSDRKNYTRDILRPLSLISRLTAKGAPFEGVKHTTQFIVGASAEPDKDIVNRSWDLYRHLGLNRAYFSAYQRGLGEKSLPGENMTTNNSDILMREHRLYQTDWLMRKYGFLSSEIPFNEKGNLSLETDPKELWAKHHPEYFPVNINKAGKFQLLRIPGMGHIMAQKIISLRASNIKLRRMEDLGRPGKRLKKAAQYVTF
ncbi:radical SAM protein [Candidatus Omnitrophota bacterium]